MESYPSNFVLSFAATGPFKLRPAFFEAPKLVETAGVALPSSGLFCLLLSHVGSLDTSCDRKSRSNAIDTSRASYQSHVGRN
jgi:hypothetical protein